MTRERLAWAGQERAGKQEHKIYALAHAHNGRIVVVVVVVVVAWLVLLRVRDNVHPIRSLRCLRPTTTTTTTLSIVTNI